MEEPEKMQYHPIQILVDELKCKDLERKKTAIKNIKTLAVVLGPEETRNHLLKEIADLLDEKEVLMEFLKPEVVNDLLHFVGGTKHIKSLLDPLQSLSSRDDEDKRKAALHAIKGLVLEAKPKVVQEDVIEMALDLLNGEWFTSKISGLKISLFMLNQEIRQENKEKLVEEILKVSKDQVHFLRRSLAASISEILNLGDTFPREKLVKLAKELVSDSFDTVRTAAMDGVFALCEEMGGKGLGLFEEIWGF